VPKLLCFITEIVCIKLHTNYALHIILPVHILILKYIDLQAPDKALTISPMY